MNNTAERQSSTPINLAARSRDWTDYRRRAIEAGTDFLNKVDNIINSLRMRRFQSEAEGKVPDASVEEMTIAGVFRAFTPLRYGGLEIPPAAFFEGIMRIAEADSSAAWIAGQLHIHSFEIALMSERMQDEFWANGPDTRASSSYAPIGKVTPVKGGYILNGTWTFSSGVDHAQWVILGNHDKAHVVPISDVAIDHGSWDVQGLKGTGSKAVSLQDVFVPDYRTHYFVDVYNDENPGWLVNNVPLYWCSFMSMFFSTPVNTAVGTSLNGIKTFIEQSKKRLTSQGTGSPVAQNPFLHLKVADALTTLGALRDRHLANWHQMFELACQGEVTTSEERMRVRFEAANLIGNSFDKFAELWPVAGAAATSSTNPLQQTFRDLMAVRNHGSGGREVAAGMYIKEMFGLPPAPFKDFGTLGYYK